MRTVNNNIENPDGKMVDLDDDDDDNDGIPDAEDPDDDNDGILDEGTDIYIYHVLTYTYVHI